MRCTGRPSSSTASCTRRRTSTARRRSRDPARATRTPGCVGAYVEQLRPVRLPAVLAARTTTTTPTGSGRRRRSSRSRGRTAARGRAGRAGRRHRAVPGRPRRDPDVRSRADLGVGARSTSRRRSRTGGCCSRTIRIADGAELAVAPGARSAMVYMIDRGGVPGAGRPARLLKRLRTIEGVEVLAWMDGDEACVWSERGELRFSPRRARRMTVAATAGTSTGASRRSSWRRATESLASRTYPDALRRIWSALHVPGRGRRAGVGDTRVRVHRLGRRRPRRRWQPRVAAPRRLARDARVRELRPRLPTPAAEWPAQWSITDVAPVVDVPLRAARMIRRQGDRPRPRAGGVLPRLGAAPRRAAGVAGWVRNRSDGSVEAVFEGEAGRRRAAGRVLPDGPARSERRSPSTCAEERRAASTASRSSEAPHRLSAPAGRLSWGRCSEKPRLRPAITPCASAAACESPPTGSSWSSSRPWARAATSSTWRCTRRWSTAPACTTSWRPCSPSASR